MQKISIKEENNMKVKNKIEKQSNNNVKNIITNYPFNNKSGVTLIALIVTIIVLLIISGIVINSIIGSNGILTNSKNAVNKYKKAQAEEAVGLLLQEYQMENANSNISFEDWLKKMRDETGEIEDYENQGDGTIAITKDGYIVFVDIDGTHIIEDRETEKVGGVQPEVTAKLYSTDGKEITDQCTVIENEYITITVNNKKKLDSIDSIKVYNAGGKEITEKSDTPVGDNKADASFKLTAKGKYVIRVKGTKKGLQRSKVVTVDVENLPDAPVDNLQGTYKLYTINGTEISNEKHAKEVLTLKLTNITAYDKVDTEYVKLVKKATTDGEEDKEISKILNNGNIGIVGDNSDKTGIASYYITENGVYTATIAASKYGFQKTTTFDITVNNIELATPEMKIKSSDINGSTTRKKITATVTNSSSFDTSTISIDNKLSEDSNNGTTAEFTVSKNQTYTITVTGTKDGMTNTSTGTIDVSGLAAVAPTISVSQAAVSSYPTTRKQITIKITNTSSFDSSTITMSNALSQSSNDGTTAVYIVNKNQSYSITATGTKDGYNSSASTTTTVSGLAAPTPTVTLTSTANGTTSATLTATVTNSSSFDSLSITLAGTTTTGSTATKTVTSNGTYQVSVVGTRDGFTSATTTKQVAVSNIGLSTSTSYVGKYVDCDNNGTPDGLILTDNQTGTAYALNSNGYVIKTGSGSRFLLMRTQDWSTSSTWYDAVRASETIGSTTFSLPSLDNLQKFYGHGLSGNYWSSTESDRYSAYYVIMGNGHTNNDSKYYYYKVRLCATF